MKCKNCLHNVGIVANRIRHLAGKTANVFCKNLNQNKNNVCGCTNPEPEPKQ